MMDQNAIIKVSSLATISEALANAYKRLAETKKLLDKEDFKKEEQEYLAFSIGYIEQSINHYRDLLKVIESSNTEPGIIKPVEIRPV